MRPSSPGTRGSGSEFVTERAECEAHHTSKDFFGLCRGSYGASRGDPRALWGVSIQGQDAHPVLSRLRTVASAQTNNPGHDRVRQLFLPYVIGTMFDIPHGHTSCIMLPAVMRWNKPANTERQAMVAAAMGHPGEDAGDVLDAF